MSQGHQQSYSKLQGNTIEYPQDVYWSRNNKFHLNISFNDRPVSGIRHPQFASNDISVTTGLISTKVDRIVPLKVLY